MFDFVIILVTLATVTMLVLFKSNCKNWLIFFVFLTKKDFYFYTTQLCILYDEGFTK